jgi:hypothetical protein
MKGLSYLKELYLFYNKQVFCGMKATSSTTPSKDGPASTVNSITEIGLAIKLSETQISEG